MQFNSIRIHHECDGGVVKSTRLVEWWQRDGIFYPILTRMMDYFSCSPLNTSLILKKKTLKIQNTLRCDMVISFYHYNDGHGLTYGQRAAVFHLSLRLVRVCFVFVLLLYAPVNSYSYYGTVSSSNHTFSLASLNKRSTSTSCTYFRSLLTAILLEWFISNSRPQDLQSDTHGESLAKQLTTLLALCGPR